MSAKIDLNFYPGWVRKAITFTIDDGNVPLDRKFLSIVKPAGLRGTFNPCGREPNRYDDYPALYDGYEISNHVKHHPFAMTDKIRAVLKDETFNPETADDAFAYPTGNKGEYYTPKHGKYRDVVVDDEVYLEYTRQAQKELEEVFGKDRVKGFVWPYGRQANAELHQLLIKEGFSSIRATGCTQDKTGFAIPEDKFSWSYNADCWCLGEAAEKYEKYPDDGQLKFFCFGVHSHDFENAQKWEVLIDFCEKYGCRPETYWYAGVNEIFEYEAAVKAVRIDDECGRVINDSDKDLFITVNGNRAELRAHSGICTACVGAQRI